MMRKLPAVEEEEEEAEDPEEDEAKDPVAENVAALRLAGDHPVAGPAAGRDHPGTGQTAETGAERAAALTESVSRDDPERSGCLEDLKVKNKQKKNKTCFSNIVRTIHSSVIIITGWRTLREFSDFRDFCLHFREK
jgi:hypothetical protein